MREIEEFITQNEDMNVETSPGVSYSVRDIINEAYRLYGGKFKAGEYEENGFKRIFMRKMWVVYRTLIQGSDIDMKNFNMRSLNGVKIKIAALVKDMFISHLSINEFGEKIDDILASMCWFGSAIVKRVDGDIDLVDLRNYITEPNIQSAQDRKHLEMVYYTYDQVMSHKEDWDNFDSVEKVWEEMQKEGESQFKIIEFWTWGTVKEGGDIHKICVKALDNTITEKDSFNDTSDWEAYVELERFVTPYKRKRTSKRIAKKLGEYEEMFPYEQFDLFKVQGRAIAMGCAELLTGCNEMYQELFTGTRKQMLKSQTGMVIHTAIQGTKGLTQLTQDFISNLSTNPVTTLAPGETLQNFPVDVKASDFALMEEKIYELMRQIIGITSQGTGEEMPASTSATQASINQQVANTVFDYTKERMHHGMKRLFNNGYADDIIDELDAEEVAAIIGDPTQLEEMDNYLVENAINKWVTDMKAQTGMYPQEQEIATVYAQIKQDLMSQGDMRFPEFKKALLKDMKYMFDFSLTQEAFDIKQRSDALIAMKNDPTSTKSKAKIEDELLTLQGLSPRDYDKSQEEIAEEQQLAQQEQMQAQQGIQAPAPIM